MKIYGKLLSLMLVICISVLLLPVVPRNQKILQLLLLLPLAPQQPKRLLKPQNPHTHSNGLRLMQTTT